jgi:hypothetical protein
MAARRSTVPQNKHSSSYVTFLYIFHSFRVTSNAVLLWTVQKVFFARHQRVWHFYLVPCYRVWLELNKISYKKDVSCRKDWKPVVNILSAFGSGTSRRQVAGNKWFRRKRTPNRNKCSHWNTRLYHFSLRVCFQSQRQSQIYFTTDGLPAITSSWRQAAWDWRTLLFFNWTLPVIVLM